MNDRKGECTMITLPKVRMERVCVSKRDRREILKEVHFTPNEVLNSEGNVERIEGEGMLTAADGFALAVIPVNHGADDVEGNIPNAAIADAIKASKHGLALLESLPDRVVHVNGVKTEYPRTDAGQRYPDFQSLVGGYAKSKKEENTIRVAIDADKLIDLANALCERSSYSGKVNRYMMLTIDTANLNGPLLIEPLIDEGELKGRFGLLMPVHKW